MIANFVEGAVRVTMQAKTEDGKALHYQRRTVENIQSFRLAIFNLKI